MTTITDRLLQPIQEPNPVAQDETPSTCERILKITGIALAAIACFVVFVLSPIAGAIASAFALNHYYRGEEDTLGRTFLNGIAGGAVYTGFSYLNTLFFAII